MRVGLSEAAIERLGRFHVLRLLEIELYDVASVISESLDGPLEEDAIRVWIEVPTKRQVRVEVGRPGRPVLRSTFAIQRAPSNAAARVVAIAISEMVRDQVQPLEPVKPKPDGGDDDGSTDLVVLAPFALAGSASVLLLPGATSPVIYGTELSLTLRQGFTGQMLYGRWLTSAGDDLLRWLEIGAALDLQLVLPAPTWRLHFAARAGAVSLAAPLATAGDEAAARTARAGLWLGVETRIDQAAWLGLAVEPGGVLATSGLRDSDGDAIQVGGFTLGLSLGLAVEPLGT